MYLDTSISIDFPMPLSLANDVKDIEAAYYAGDDFHFILKLEDLECIAKACAINGSITKQQLDAIFRRYGLR